MIPQGVVSECHSSVMVLATRMRQMVLPSSVWPAAHSDLLWEFLSLQMLLLIQAGPTSNTRTLWPSSIMCGEASTCRSSFGVTLALRKEAEGQDSQWPCCSSLQLCSSPGQESQGSPAVTHHSSTVLAPPFPASPHSLLLWTISHQMSESTHHIQTPHILISILPDPRAVFPRIHQFSKMGTWSPGAAALCVCQGSPRSEDFLEALQDCTARHNGDFVARNSHWRPSLFSFELPLRLLLMEVDLGLHRLVWLLH